MSLTRIESKNIILSDVVSSYFPSNIKKMFDLPEEGLFFFGESISGTDKEIEGEGKFSSKYLSVLHKPDITKTKISFVDSDKRWVRSEHREFIQIQNSYPNQLSDSYPLLILRLTSEYMRADKPIHYINLLRYADHAMFRKRGIATQVFDSVSNKCKIEEVKYLYMCAWFNLPSTSKWLSRIDVPKKDLEYISTLFFNKPIHKVLQWSDSYLRIL